MYVSKYQVSELRARLKATSRALQAREKGAAELRQAVQELERDRRAEQTKSRAQAKKTEEQVSSSDMRVIGHPLELLRGRPKAVAHFERSAYFLFARHVAFVRK